MLNAGLFLREGLNRKILPIRQANTKWTNPLTWSAGEKDNTVTSSSLNVLLVEDNRHMRQHLEKIIALSNDFHITSAATYHAAKSMLSTTMPDFLVLDLGLPDGDGMDLIAPALKLNPDMLILVLTVFGEDSSVIRAIQAGAKGYLLKDRALNELPEVLISMQNGASPIDHRVARALLQLVTNQQRPEKIDAFHLSDSERAVLSHIAQGKMYKEIAHTMDISINTVREFVRRIYKKLHVNSRSQAVQRMSEYDINPG